jgi:tetratricopeptide (TPR) repeat protein
MPFERFLPHARSPRSPRLLGTACLAGLLLTACEGGGKDSGLDPLEQQIIRERAAAMFAEEKLVAALDELRPLIDGREPLPEDLVRAAICELALGGADAAARAEEYLNTALESEPGDLRARFNLGRLYYDDGRFEKALPLLEGVAEELPEDFPTVLFVGGMLNTLAQEAEDRAGEDGSPEADALYARVEGLYDQLYARGVEFGGSWFHTLLFRRFSLYRDLGRFDEMDRATEERERLQERGFPEPTNTDLQRGNLGSLVAPAPIGNKPALAPDEPDFEALASLSFETPARQVRFASIVEEWHAVTAKHLKQPMSLPPNTEPRLVVVDGSLGEQDLLRLDAAGLWIVPAEGDAPSAPALPGDFESFALLDLGDDRDERLAIDNERYTRTGFESVSGSDLEIVLVERQADDTRLLWLYEQDGFDGSWARREAPLAEYPGEVRDLTASDHDHDGDLDLIWVGDAGLRLLRHDGAEGTGGFTDASEQFGLGEQPFTWLVADDFDADQDVDFLFGGSGAPVWLSSLRRSRWQDRSADLNGALVGDERPLAQDFTGNGFPDLVQSAQGRLAENGYGERFLPRADALPGKSPADANAVALDVDQDGAFDLLWRAPDGSLAGVLAVGLAGERNYAADLDEPLPAGPLATGRLNLGGAWRARLSTGAGPVLATVPDADTGHVTLGLKGIKDNQRGVGAIVELRAGSIYERIYWDGRARSLPIGDRAQIDVLRVTWPNGVIQSQLDVPVGATRVLEQIEGLAGSCPFLYTWDGETFTFISDVIGITPLGLPMAPGMLVPPDHDEYVLVTQEQMVPVIDHPEGSEIYPNERFSFPPFPEAHTFVVERQTAPLAAVDDSGHDWAAELAAIDDEYAKPFEPYRGQYMGLTDLHTLTLSFDPVEVATAERPRLLMTGWLYWTDASVNMAVARHPDHEFLPPLLQVPDGEGGWRDAGPPVGFPAGKTKTMVLDVAGLLDPEDPRIRVVTTLRLYWDAIRLATCDDQGETRVTELDPNAAELWNRGFSRPVFLEDSEGLEWFEWDQLTPQPRWNQHPGSYTRFGDVLELTTAVDDRFVIMGSGDCLTLRFPTEGLPELPDGWRRDFLVFLDGWAKDRDPNTHEALFVEPLPFHGMSGYPYGEDESFPDDEAHRDYQRTWNTRSGVQHIRPLAPVGGRH